MIGPGIQGPIVRPFYNHGRVIPISHRLIYSLAKIAPPNFASLTILNVAATAGDVLVLFLSFDGVTGASFAGATWGADVNAGLIQGLHGLNPYETDIITIPVSATGVSNLVVTLSLATGAAVLVATPFFGLSSALFDRTAVNTVPPDLAANPADSGFTAATTFGHEAVVGCVGEILSVDGGLLDLPTSGILNLSTGSVLHPALVNTAWDEVTALGQYKTRWVLHAANDWGALCGTLKGF